MTNNTFTPAARELAKKTGVLLWENSKVSQSSNNSFWLTKCIGVFGCMIGILGLITMWGVDPKVLQYIMGHGQISVTMNVYNHVSAERNGKEMDKLEKMRLIM